MNLVSLSYGCFLVGARVLQIEISYGSSIIISEFFLPFFAN